MIIIILCVCAILLYFISKPKDNVKANSSGSNSNSNIPPKESSWDKVIRYHNTFVSYLADKGVACTDVNECMVGLPFSGENLKNFEIMVVFGTITDHKVEVNILGWDFVHFSTDKRDAIIAACNECNTDPQIRFIPNENNDVRTLMQAYVDENRWCEQCEALARQMADIVDRSYPILDRALDS